MIKSCKKVYELLVFAFGKFLSNLLIDNVRFSAKNVLGSSSLCVNVNNKVNKKIFTKILTSLSVFNKDCPLINVTTSVKDRSGLCPPPGTTLARFSNVSVAANASNVSNAYNVLEVSNVSNASWFNTVVSNVDLTANVTNVYNVDNITKVLTNANKVAEKSGQLKN